MVRKLFTPTRKTAIGPTPQKDGNVLGIFDLLSEDGVTPSKDLSAQTRNINATPSKSVLTNGSADAARRSRTPASPGKRFMLDSFATPLKSRHPNELISTTPSSLPRLHFATPSFLRRDSQRITMPTLEEDDEGLSLSPQMFRQPKKPLVRGLSSVLAELRKMEEDDLDDDLDALRDMENDAPPQPSKSPAEGVLVKDSQVPALLGGFDSEADLDSDPEEIKNPILGPGGLPLKIYKKKGQKRTTRRTRMRPTQTRSNGTLASLPVDEDSDTELAQHIPADLIPETQSLEPGGFADARNFDSDSASEYTASEGGTRYKRPNQSKKSRRTDGGGLVKNVARKLGGLAHTNFKRLKLRNSGAKGGAAHNSRFRRKR